MSKITVIITVHKDRGWIDDAILSVKNQTFTDYDIILASNGNPAIELYAKKHNIPFFLYPKNNCAILMNNAIKIATGEWIKILNDDDMLKQNCLKDLYDARGKSSLVYGNCEILSGRNIKIYKPPNKVGLKDLLVGNRINWVGVMFKKKVFDEVGGFDTMLQYAPDLGIYLSILSADYSFAYCDNVVAIYRRHKGQLTGHRMDLRKKDLVYINLKYNDKTNKGK